MPREISLDIETLSLRPDATIVSIGACVINTHEFEDDDFHERVCTESQFARHVDRNTWEWWQSAANEKARELEFGGTTHLRDVLNALSHYITKIPGTLVWCNHDLFDLGVLKDAYIQYGRPVPWDYRCVRDLATLRASWPKIELPNDPNEIPHTALGDAKHQARMIRAIQSEIKSATSIPGYNHAAKK